ncbi:MAG: hypothetical protein KAH10_00735 [Flavobacteriales bacterium]|nr:hypothetical protein [Flavobacteriales bacterium]
MKNPWINYDFTNSTIHELDKDFVEVFNLSAEERFKLNSELLPDPYIGNIKSKILLLALNPGLSEDDFRTHADLNYKELHRENINQEKTKFPFYYLNPKLESPGSRWWFKKLRWLIEKFNVEKISNSVYCLQYLPYHSVEFKKTSKLIPTQNFTKKILENHISNNYPIIIMRSKKYWVELVPELEKYENAFLLRNPRNPTLSPNNIGENNFDRLVELISE